MIREFFIKLISGFVFVIIFLYVYLYLTEPFSFSYNIMGMEIGMKIWYQPFTTCVYSETSFFGSKRNDSRCGVGIFEYLEMRNRTEKMIGNFNNNIFSD